MQIPERKMSTTTRWHQAYQARKIRAFRVTGHVCPHLEIFRMLNTIQHQLHAWSLSKNALLSKHSLKTALFIQVDRCLPAT
jgi:hypothetical protein